MSLMMKAVRTSETSVDNHFTRQYIPEDNSEQNGGSCTMRSFLICKSKAVPLHAMEALGGRGGRAPTHSLPRH
jgi:hypothetical protein